MLRLWEGNITVPGRNDRRYQGSYFDPSNGRLASEYMEEQRQARIQARVNHINEFYGVRPIDIESGFEHLRAQWQARHEEIINNTVVLDTETQRAIVRDTANLNLERLRGAGVGIDFSAMGDEPNLDRIRTAWHNANTIYGFTSPSSGRYTVTSAPSEEWSLYHNRKHMRILDKKTIKKIRFFVKSHVTRMRLADWKDYYNLLSLQETYNQLTDQGKEKIKAYRKRIKAYTELHAKISPEISTYVTFSHDYKPINFETRLEAYKYLLQRLKEKIRVARHTLRTPKTTNKEIVLGVVVQMQGLVHIEPQTFSDAIHRHIIDNCFQPKVPKPDLFPYIGLELECFIEINQRDLARKLKKFSGYVEIKDDGSIEIDDELNEYSEDEDGDRINEGTWEAFEIAILVPEKEMKTVIPEIVSILKKLDARVNDSCGMHVHLDMRNRNTETVFRNLTLYQDIMFQLVDESRRDNTYCQKVDTNYYDDEKENHYNAISGKAAYSKYRTFEVRIHHGTVNSKEIMAWLDLLTRIANYPSFMDKKDNLKLLAETISLDNETLEFYNQKIS